MPRRDDGLPDDALRPRPDAPARAPRRRSRRPCAFLASDDASAITGIDLTVDCGLTANWYILETLETRSARGRRAPARSRSGTSAAGTRSSSRATACASRCCRTRAPTSTSSSTSRAASTSSSRLPWGLRPPGRAAAPGGGDGLEFIAELRGRLAGALAERQRRVRLRRASSSPSTARWRCCRGRPRCSTSRRTRSPSGSRSGAGRLPFRLERVMRLSRGSADLVVEGTVTNEGAGRLPFVWGQHLVLGPPFLERGLPAGATGHARSSPPTRSGSRPPGSSRDNARQWPHGLLRRGGTVDLRDVPGPEAGSHDDLFVGGLHGGQGDGDEPPARPALRADLGQRGLSVGRPVAAVRRRDRSVARRLVRSRGRAVDVAALPRAGGRGGPGDLARGGGEPADDDRRVRSSRRPPGVVDA